MMRIYTSLLLMISFVLMIIYRPKLTTKAEQKVYEMKFWGLAIEKQRDNIVASCPAIHLMGVLN